MGFPTASTFRFSGGALTYVRWYFIHHRPLQPVVVRHRLHYLENHVAIIAGTKGTKNSR
jgi:hypothetical protein